MRKCCGYYCALVALIGIFFYGVMIAMEVRRNQFVLWKLQYPESTAEQAEYKGKTAPEVMEDMEKFADGKVTSMAIAIGLNVVCIIGCLVQVKVGEKQAASALRAQLAQEQEESKEN